MTGERPSADDDAFGREVRGLAWAWVALLALMLASLGSAYLRLGIGNPLAGIAIALVKAGIVAWLFMDLRRAPAMIRLAAAIGIALLLLMMTLGSVDYATRARAPAAWQMPQQIEPAFAGPSARPGR